MLIGITGLAGSGKSEVARVLMDEFGFQRIKFADPLKNMTRSLLRDIGYCEFDVERYVEGDLKESLIPEIGVTSREIQKLIGQKFGREGCGADVWANIADARFENRAGERVLSDDARHLNELQRIHARGGCVWRVNRPGVPMVDHPSERDIPALPVDLNLHNDGSLADLRAVVRAYARDFACS